MNVFSLRVKRLHPWRSLLLTALAVATTGWLSAAAQTPTVGELFDAYLAGNRTEAVRAFAAWPEKRVAAETLRFGDGVDPWRRFALAMFDTEAGLLNLTFAADAGNNPLGGGQLEPHATRASALITSLLADAQTPAEVLRACRSWLVFASSFRKHVQGHAEPINNETLSRLRALGANATNLLLQASLTEALTGHLPQEPHMAIGADEGDVFASTPHGMFNETRALRAERGFRAALAADPELTEATLRLGRLSYLVGSAREARPLLERASTAPSQPRWEAGLADLFLAELHGFEGRPDDAMAAYRRAIARDPSLEPAYIGLSYLQLEQGRESDSADTLNAALLAQQQAGALWNPLATYESAQFHAANEQLADLRQVIASKFGASKTALPAFAYLSPPPVVSTVAQLPATSAQAKAAPRSGTLFSETEGVRLVVRVTKDGQPVRGLRASDFIVTDRSVRQEVSSVSEPSGLLIATAIDISQSSAAQMLRVAGGARVIASAMRDDDRMTVLTVSDAVMSAANNVPPSRRLTDLLAGMKPDRFGMTALWDGIYSAITLAESRERIPYVLVSGTQCGTGGGDNASWLAQSQLVSLAKRSGVVIDAVWNSRSLEKGRPDRGSYREMDIVFGSGHANDVVVAADGRTFSADDPDLATKLRRRLDDVRQGYIVTYMPKDVERGGWHPVEVRTSAGRAVTRSGYGKARD